MQKTYVAAILFLVAAVAGAQSTQSLVTGSITAVSGTSVTVAGMAIDVSNASITTPQGKGTAASLVPGERVTIALRSGSAAASVIVEPDVRLTGTLDTQQGQILTVAGRSIAVTSATVFGGISNARPVKALGDLAVHESVVIDASLANGGLTALRVWGQGAPARPPQAKPVSGRAELDGLIRSVDAGVLVVETTRVLMSGQTKMTGAPGVGDHVHVVGLRTPDGAILAATIEKK